MKFGKLDSLEGISLQLPSEPAANRALLGTLPAGVTPQLYIGPTGWSMKEWRGRWYPEKARSPDYLRYYGEQFNTIELNTTHYRIPDVDTVRKWYEQTPPDFRFCPKVPQTISHDGQLGLGGAGIEAFAQAIAGLGEKLGPCFVQLPPYFAADRLPLLGRFLTRWPRALPLAVELRHPSWFADTAAGDALFATLAEFGAAAVITDVAGRRDVLHLRLTAPFALVRFVGNGLIPSDYSRIEEWLLLLRSWALPEVYFFPHEPDNILAPEMVAYMVGRLGETWPAAQTRGPRPVDAPQTGAQMELF